MGDPWVFFEAMKSNERRQYVPHSFDVLAVWFQKRMLSTIVFCGTFALPKTCTTFPPSSAPRIVLPSSVKQACRNHIRVPVAAELLHRCLQRSDLREKWRRNLQVKFASQNAVQPNKKIMYNFSGKLLQPTPSPSSCCSSSFDFGLHRTLMLLLLEESWSSWCESCNSCDT